MTEQITKQDLKDTDASEGLISNQQTSSTNVISFLEQGEVTIGKFPDQISSYHSDLAPSLSRFTQDIKDFLARPLDVQAYTISGSTSTSTSYSEYNIDTYLKSPIIAQKLAGFQALSFTTRARLVVNADPFLQGRLMLIWVPNTTASCPMWDTRSLSLTTLTQFPRVEIDIATQTTAILEIPFIYPTPFYTNPNGSGGYNTAQYGSFLIYNYGSMATGTGFPAANATLYISIHNVDLNIPGSQSGGPRKPMSSVRKAPRITRNNPELNRDDVKPISGALEGLTFAASAVAQVPMISSIAAPAAWVLENLTNTAKSFGFSNPEVGVYSSPNNQVAYTNFCNADVPTYHNSLSITKDNTLVRTSYLKGNDEDELSIMGIASRPAYVGAYTWANTAPPGTTIVSFANSPAANDSSMTLSNKSVTFRTPMSFVSSFFAYWRGSITYKFKLVKTKYHSGRIMVTYVPKGSVSFQATTSSGYGLYNLRKIVDISDLTEFDITIPYMHIDPYTKGQTGTVYVTVVNELVSPDSVSNSVQILVETCAGPDMEFAVPCTAPGYFEVPVRLAQPQGGVDEMKPPSDPVTDETLGGSQMLRSSLIPAELCVGEKINSMRTILKRPGFIMTMTGTTTGGATTTVNNRNGDYIVANNSGLDPAGIYSARLATYAGSPATYQCTAPFSDTYSAIVSCFYLNRGAINYKIFCPNTAPGSYQTVTLVEKNAYNRSVQSHAKTSTIAGSSIGNLTDTYANGSMVSFQVPYYNNTPWVITSFYSQIDATNDAPLATNDYQRTARVIRTSSNVTGPVHTYRSIADDFDVGFFISTPPTTRLVGIIPANAAST